MAAPGNPLLSGLLNLFFHSPIGDAHCGLRGFRKESCERLDLSSPGMEFASEMVVKACLHGCRIAEVPVVLYPDGRDRPPHLRSFHDGWRHLRLLLLLCPLWLYLIPAVTLLAFGLPLMVWLTPGPRSLGPVTLDVHTLLLGSLCVLLGYQTLWLWWFARLHGSTSGLLPPARPGDSLFARLLVNRGLAIGAALFLADLGLNLWLGWQWSRSQWGALETSTTLRPALWALTSMVLGVQTIQGGFFTHLIALAARPGQPRGAS